ncbi:hypothetical protein FDA09_14530 [Clostridium botulinum]|uniref:phage holin family protein n=1 Tax=Clostridium botulinum TaxID=1491 RepID=UPI0007730ECB|nr:phage holin family protein [Clostridium botulinum]MBN1070506.1 hypothetical protein [Clostridium botulinum]NFF80447.1 hypothetical protein [Clostridium botulinum]NFH81281.1 hypothetical protein [Clostridium botulinum]NFH84553.1 hypothetical protein [Clostridium botulinum]NFI12587.1 hypothetical protein [Clostridium botulinum]
MESILNYVKPELVIVAIALYFLGLGLKNSNTVKDNYIPIILGITGVILSVMWVLATSTINNYQDILMAIFIGITQGFTVAGLSVYVDQLAKQLNKVN